MAYERPLIQNLHAYAPGEQPASLSGVVKLNTNENPYPPAPAVMAAIAGVSADALRRYPSPSAAAFREAAAQRYGVDADQVLCTNGGDELLRMLIQVFAEPGGVIGLSEPTYTLYAVLAAAHGAKVAKVERGENFELPEDLAQQWNAAGATLAFVVNPHAPTGRFESPAALAALARAFKGVLVVDEAYVDFAPDSCLSLVRGPAALPNVVLLRSMSKGYGLAGLRFGYGIGSAPLVAALHKVRDSYNCDVLSQAAAIAALGAQDYYQPRNAEVKAERGRLAAALRGRGWQVPDSHTNFLLATPPLDGNFSAFELYGALKVRRILVRYFKHPRLDDKLRITVGTPEQDDRLLAELDDIVSGSTGAFQPFPSEHTDSRVGMQALPGAKPPHPPKLP